MRSELLTRFKLVGSGSIAFLIVVCAAYASAITALLYARRPLAAWEIIVLCGAGIAYLVVGTYGFARCRKSNSLAAAIIYFVVQLSLAVTLILLRGSSGELSMILLPLAGQSALLLPLRAMVPICALIYVTLVMPLLLRIRWNTVFGSRCALHVGGNMRFILGLILFIVVIGWLDAGLPWPRCGSREARR